MTAITVPLEMLPGLRQWTWTRTRFPMIDSIEYRWSGEVLESIDGLAFIGHNPLDKANVYIATGVPATG